MSTKRKNNNNIHLYILIGIFLVVVLILFSALSKNQTTNENSRAQNSISITPSIKTYSSKILDITIDLPTEFAVEEQFTNTITINKVAVGQIKIEKLYTNSKNIEDYFLNYDSKRTIEVIKKAKLKIAGYDTVVRILKFHSGSINQEKVYTIYVNGQIYAFSTSSESLYPELDQIARSFRITP